VEGQNKRCLPLFSFEVGTLVLKYNAAVDNQYKASLEAKWSGPYRVKEEWPKNTYRLEELNGTELKMKTNGNLLKQYYIRKQQTAMPATDEEM
jgi:hypothetical protein